MNLKLKMEQNALELKNRVEEKFVFFIYKKKFTKKKTPFVEKKKKILKFSNK